MTFIEWLTDELSKTDSDEIEIGFNSQVTLDEVFENDHAIQKRDMVSGSSIYL